MTATRSASALSIFYSCPYALGKVGVGSTALHQINALASLGHCVDVLAPRLADSVYLHPAVTFVATREVLGRRLPPRVVDTLGGQMRLHDLRAAWLLRRRQPRRAYDIVHTWPRGGVRTHVVAAARGVPVAREVPNTHTAHAYDVVEREAAALGIVIPPENSHYRDGGRLAREEAEWSTATSMLVPSEASRRSFLDRGFPPERLQRHRYGCVMPPFPAARKRGRQFTAVFLGSAEPRKGLHHALRAWSASGANRTGRLLIGGRFMTGYRQAIQHLLDDPSIVELGFVEQPLTLLSEADVLLLPSIEEGSAIVTYEAQAVGCIPLVSDASGAFLDHDVQGLVHPTGDVVTLAEHLRAVSTDDRVRERLRNAALAHRSELSWEAAGVVLVGAYHEIIARHGGVMPRSSARAPRLRSVGR